MAFNRQLYKQKPSAWGPVSAVQASIFKNAERAGIDPASIALAMPMWNLFDYSKNNHVLSNIGVDFVNNSALFLAGNYLYFSSDKIKGNIGTVFLHCESVGAPDLYGVVLFGTNTTTPVWQQINLETNNKDVVFGRELNAYTKVLGTFFNSKNKSVIFWSDGSIGGLKLLINNIQISTAPAQAGVSYAAGSKTFRIGNWAGGINWDFSGIMGCFFYFDTALKYSQITYLSDNPYYLLQRVAPVYYSVPGGAGGVTISSTTGTVVVTGYDVGIETGVTISVNTGTLTVDGFSVDIEQGTSVQVTTGEIYINGLNPDIVQGIQFIVTQGMVTINSFDTTVLNGTEINITSKNVSITGYAVEVEQGIIITSSIESIVITGYNVSVTNELVISLNFGSVIIAGYNTTVLAGTRIDLTKAEITITGLDLEIEQGTQIDVTSETVIVTGLDVSIENALSINVITGSVNVLGYPVSVYAGILVEATTGNVAITGYNPTVAQSSGVEVTTGQVTITGLDTTIECTVLIEPTTGMVIIASYDVTVTDGLVAETPITRTNIVAASNRVITNSGSSRLMTNSNSSRLIVIT